MSNDKPDLSSWMAWPKSIDNTQPTPNPPDPQPFRLLDLPPELLLQILALAIVNPNPICIHPPTACPSSKTQYTHINLRTQHRALLGCLKPPAIARVNRLLRLESLKLFYEKNVFHGVNWSEPVPREWVGRIPEEWRREMVCVVSSGWEAGDVEAHFEAGGVRCRVRRIGEEDRIRRICDAAGESHLYAVSFGV